MSKKPIPPAPTKVLVPGSPEMIAESDRLALLAVESIAQSQAMIPQFPKGTQFFDVEGVPVTIDQNRHVRAWDAPEPRWFPLSSVDHNGTIIPEAQFLAMVEIESIRNGGAKGAKPESKKPPKP